MTFSIKNGRYAFLIRLDLMFSMSLWKELQLLQILNDLSITNLIKLILYENIAIEITLFLSDLISPLVPNDYSCKETFSFVS